MGKSELNENDIKNLVKLSAAPGLEAAINHELDDEDAAMETRAIALAALRVRIGRVCAALPVDARIRCGESECTVSAWAGGVVVLRAIGGGGGVIAFVAGECATVLANEAIVMEVAGYLPTAIAEYIAEIRARTQRHLEAARALDGALA